MTDVSVTLEMAVPTNADAGMAVIEAGVLLFTLPVFMFLNFEQPCIDGIWLMGVSSKKTIVSRLVNPLKTEPAKPVTCAPSMYLGIVTSVLFVPRFPVMVHWV